MLRRLTADDPDLEHLLPLLGRAFAEMEGRIDPPSSLGALTPTGLARQATEGEIWVIGTPPVACLFLSWRPGALYLHKLATDPGHRGRGHAARLVDLARRRVAARSVCWLDPSSRVELTGTHAALQALGFAEAGRAAHPGFDRPTSITFRALVG